MNGPSVPPVATARVSSTMVAGPSWPVILHHDGLVLRPLRARDAGRWAELRTANRDWTGPWDSTLPPGSGEEPLDFPRLVRRYRRLGVRDRPSAGPSR